MDYKLKSSMGYEIFTILHIGPLVEKKVTFRSGIKVATVDVAFYSLHSFDFDTC